MRSLLAGPVVTVAPLLLGGSVLSDVYGERVAARIVEVEAYAGQGQDPASYAHRGWTPGSARMFGPPGIAFVRYLYGMHWCLNVAVGPAGEGSAVLLRAAAIVDGVSVARRRRTAPSGRTPGDRDLARGPARLCQALGVTGAQDGLDLLDPTSPLRLSVADQPVVPGQVARGPRVGVRHAADRPWRFWLDGRPEVSAYRGAVGARPTEGGR
jgi:DNA-3-methyladenine glycosylase